MESIRYSLLSRQDLKVGTGQFEITLADGRIVSVDEIDIGKLLELTPIKTYATTADLPATGSGVGIAGRLARVTADNGLYMDSGTAWTAVGGAGTHTHPASDIVSGQIAAARGGTALDSSATVQGSIWYFNALGALAALSPGAIGTFLKSGGAGANLSWDTPGSATHALDSHSDVPAITEAQGQILYYNGSNWVALAVGTSGQFLQTQGAAANPQWAAIPTVLDKVTTNVVVTNTVTEINIYSKSIDANSLSTNNALRLTIFGTHLENGVGSDTVTIRYKYGATTLITQIVATWTDGATANRQFIQFVLAGDAATNAQIARAWWIGVIDGAGGDINADINKIGNGTAAIDSTIAQNLVVSVQFANANANRTFTMEYAILEKLV